MLFFFEFTFIGKKDCIYSIAKVLPLCENWHCFFVVFFLTFKTVICALLLLLLWERWSMSATDVIHFLHKHKCFSTHLFCHYFSGSFALLELVSFAFQSIQHNVWGLVLLCCCLDAMDSFPIALAFGKTNNEKLPVKTKKNSMFRCYQVYLNVEKIIWKINMQIGIESRKVHPLSIYNIGNTCTSRNKYVKLMFFKIFVYR